MEFTITRTNTDKIYNELMYEFSEYIRDNYIDVLKTNNAFYATHYKIKCVCTQLMPLYVYGEHQKTSYHQNVINRNLEQVDSVIKNHLLSDIVSIVKQYLYISEPLGPMITYNIDASPCTI